MPMHMLMAGGFLEGERRDLRVFYSTRKRYIHCVIELTTERSTRNTSVSGDVQSAHS